MSYLPGTLDRLASWAREAPWWQLGAVLGVGALLAGAACGRSAPPAPSLGSRRRNGRKISGVVYAPGETGWVEDLGDGTFRVSNVPFFSPLNVDDVVLLDDSADGRLKVGRVLARVFDRKSGVRYPEPHRKNFAKLARAFEREGWKLEGGTAGLVVLAHDSSASPCCVAEDAGVDVIVERLPLRS